MNCREISSRSQKLVLGEPCLAPWPLKVGVLQESTSPLKPIRGVGY